MTTPATVCKECGSETHVTPLPSFSGEEGPIKVVIDGMPAVVCAKNHKRFLSAAFVPQLMDFVAVPEKIAPQPPAVKRGLLKKHYYCSGCDTELPSSPTRTADTALDASFKNAAPFKVTVQVALFKCDKCGREQVRSNEELMDGAFKAMAHGFRAVDVHPDR